MFYMRKVVAIACSYWKTSLITTVVKLKTGKHVAATTSSEKTERQKDFEMSARQIHVCYPQSESCMGSFMLLAMWWLAKGLFTMLTYIGLLSCVSSFMSLTGWWPSKGLFTMLACIWLHCEMARKISRYVIDDTAVSQTIGNQTIR